MQAINNTAFPQKVDRRNGFAAGIYEREPPGEDAFWETIIDCLYDRRRVNGEFLLLYWH